MIDLNRFLKAQENTYDIALEEIRAGKKKTHWMWFIFPQLKGLGFSSTSMYYGIDGKEEAIAYYNHPILGARLKEICGVLESLKETNPVKIFGSIDALKLCSCLTLFYKVSNDEIFKNLLIKYYNGQFDENTLKMID